MAIELTAAQQERIQRLRHAGILKDDVSDDLLRRLASLSDAEITHFISAKTQVGDISPDDLGGLAPF